MACSRPLFPNRCLFITLVCVSIKIGICLYFLSSVHKYQVELDIPAEFLPPQNDVEATSFMAVGGIMALLQVLVMGTVFYELENFLKLGLSCKVLLICFFIGCAVKMSVNISQGMGEENRSKLQIDLHYYQIDKDVKDRIDELQSKLQCCGLYKYSDWTFHGTGILGFKCVELPNGTSICTYPPSCCKDQTAVQGKIWKVCYGPKYIPERKHIIYEYFDNSAEDPIYTRGCLTTLDQYLHLQILNIIQATTFMVLIEIATLYIEIKFLTIRPPEHEEPGDSTIERNSFPDYGGSRLLVPSIITMPVLEEVVLEHDDNETEIKHDVKAVDIERATEEAAAENIAKKEARNYIIEMVATEYPVVETEMQHLSEISAIEFIDEEVTETSVEPMADEQLELTGNALVESAFEVALEPIVLAEIQPVDEACLSEISRIEFIIEGTTETITEALIDPIPDAQLKLAADALVESIIETAAQTIVLAEIQPIGEAESQNLAEITAKELIAKEAKQSTAESLIEPKADAQLELISNALMESSSKAAAEPMVPSEIHPVGEVKIQLISNVEQPVGEAETHPAGEAEIQPIGEVKIQLIGKVEIQPVDEVEMHPIGKRKIQPVGEVKLQLFGKVERQPIGAAERKSVGPEEIESFGLDQIPIVLEETSIGLEETSIGLKETSIGLEETSIRLKETSIGLEEIESIGLEEMESICEADTELIVMEILAHPIVREAAA